MHRALRPLLGIALLAALLPVSAHAEVIDPNNPNTVQVGPDSSGPTVTQGAAEFDHSGIGASAQSQPTAPPPTSAPTSNGSYDGPVYTWREVPYQAIPITGPPTMDLQTGAISQQTGPGSRPACPDGQTGYYVYDSNGNSLGLICVPNPSGNLPPPTSPEIALAEQASSHQPWPQLVMGINPNVGLTGLPSWFWLTGANTQIQDASATAGPLTVTVHAALAGVSWEFGDGLGYDSSDIGRPYPQASDVQHTYQWDTIGRPQGIQVVAILRYLVTYRVGGGPWQQLGVKTTAFTQPYSIYQLQPEAIPPA